LVILRGDRVRLLTDSYISLFLDGRRTTVSGLLADLRRHILAPDRRAAGSLKQDDDRSPS
jgi:hypothetical protein